MLLQKLFEFTEAFFIERKNYPHTTLSQHENIIIGLVNLIRDIRNFLHDKLNSFIENTQILGGNSTDIPTELPEIITFTLTSS